MITVATALRQAGLCLLLVGAGHAHGAGVGGALARELPPREVEILLRVGREYGLDGGPLRLLLAIRKVENGGPGHEMGVASDYPRHRSHRYAADPERSLRLQAQWAAGTIRRHYTGDLEAFAKRYCPPNWAHWSVLVRHWMNKP